MVLDHDTSSKVDYYKILGIPPTASQSEVKKAYRELARRFHPDKNGGSVGAEEKFKSIQKAYGVLSDESLRRTYDANQHKYEESKNRRGWSNPSPSSFFGFSFTPTYTSYSSFNYTPKQDPPTQPNVNTSDNDQTTEFLSQRIRILSAEHNKLMEMYENRQQRYGSEISSADNNDGENKWRRGREFCELQKIFNEAEKVHNEKEKMHYLLLNEHGYDREYCRQKIEESQKKMDYCEERVKFFTDKIRNYRRKEMEGE